MRGELIINNHDTHFEKDATGSASVTHHAQTPLECRYNTERLCIAVTDSKIKRYGVVKLEPHKLWSYQGEKNALVHGTEM